MSSVTLLRSANASHPQRGDRASLPAMESDCFSEPPAGASDWSPAELENLAWLHILLIRARVSLEAERGVTDEGDPWFAFCTCQGDVFVHICRIDMTYVLDGPSLAAPLRGSNLDAMLRRFVERASTWAIAPGVPIRRPQRSAKGPSDI